MRFFLFLIFTTVLAQPAPGQPASTWLHLESETRIRHESLNRQFRAGRPGNDQLLLFRTGLHLQVRAESIKFGLELQDSRAYLGDENTRVSRSHVNPLDVLQAYAQFSLNDILGAGLTGSLILGRQTIDIGSRRQISRSNFGNVRKTYTGARLAIAHARGEEVDLVLVSPVSRLPDEQEDLENNRFERDREEWGRWLWMGFYRRQGLFPADIWSEVFVYGLHEQDKPATPSRNRQYITAGVRLYREPTAGAWDLDIEGALRWGTRRASSDATDIVDLDVHASMLYAIIGYAFGQSRTWRLAAQYYWASGDKNPDDGRSEQYERLFGSRRGDLNNTSLYGPLMPTNLSAPGLRLEWEGDRLDGRVTYSAAFLASKTDSWVVARLHDPTGNSGSFIGHEMDSRLRYWLIEDHARLEVGLSTLIHGEFATSAPNSQNDKATVYGFSSIIFSL